MPREQHPSDLPWLDRLAIRIPGYGGYARRANRRSADQALRDAIAHRLAGLRTNLEEAIRQCLDRGALTEIGALERVAAHLDRVAARVHSAGSGTDAFYGADDLDASKSDPLHALDLALFDRADALAARFHAPGPDLLAQTEADLEAFEEKLDERTLLLQGIR